MKFEYNGLKYCGTRAEIISKLENDINFLKLEYDGAWKLGTTILDHDCCPSEARIALINDVIDSVPREYVFKGKEFSDVDAFRAYLGTLEVRHLGAGVFAMGTWAQKMITNMSLYEIKDTLIEKIIKECHGF